MGGSYTRAPRRSRLLAYDFIAIAAKASPKQLLAIVETVESTGYKFLLTTAEVCKGIPSSYPYYGSKHQNVESGHHMGTEHATDYLEAIELTDEEFAETKAIVDRLYQAYTNFATEMYDWVKSHDIRDLRQNSFFRERVSDQISRPLNADELRQHRTPVAAVSAYRSQAQRHHLLVDEASERAVVVFPNSLSRCRKFPMRQASNTGAPPRESQAFWSLAT